MKKHFLMIILFVSVITLPLLALAGDPIDVSGPSGGEETIAGSINSFYNTALGLGGMAAVAVIVIGAIYYTTSGAIDKKNLGKEMITSAIWGLVLLLGAFIVLNTINPVLVRLQAPSGVEGIGGLEGEELTGMEIENEQYYIDKFCTEERIEACLPKIFSDKNVEITRLGGGTETVTGKFQRHLYYSENIPVGCMIVAYKRFGEEEWKYTQAKRDIGIVGWKPCPY